MLTDISFLGIRSFLPTSRHLPNCHRTFGHFLKVLKDIYPSDILNSDFSSTICSKRFCVESSRRKRQKQGHFCSLNWSEKSIVKFRNICTKVNVTFFSKVIRIPGKGRSSNSHWLSIDERTFACGQLTTLSDKFKSQKSFRWIRPRSNFWVLQKLEQEQTRRVAPTELAKLSKVQFDFVVIKSGPYLGINLKLTPRYQFKVTPRYQLKSDPKV